jgi:hypothetical protein
MAKKQQQARISAKARKKAEALLGRLKIYECWVATAGPEALQSAERLCGSPRQFYDWFRAGLVKIATETDGEVHGRTSV